MDRTERFRGRLMAGDRLVLDSVEGFLKTHARKPGAGGVGEWTGYFELPVDIPEPIVEGNRYRIVLIDGRSGTVFVHLSHGDEQSRPRVQFHGTGTMRR